LTATSNCPHLVNPNVHHFFTAHSFSKFILSLICFEAAVRAGAGARLAQQPLRQLHLGEHAAGVARGPPPPARPRVARARPPLAAAERGRGAHPRPAQQPRDGRQPPRPLRGARDARREGRGHADRPPHGRRRRRQRPARGQPPRPPRRRCQGNRPTASCDFEGKSVLNS